MSLERPLPPTPLPQRGEGCKGEGVSLLALHRAGVASAIVGGVGVARGGQHLLFI
jgi:hypothetical protein